MSAIAIDKIRKLGTVPRLMETNGLKRIRGEVWRFGATTGLSATLSFGLPIALHELGRVDENFSVAIGFGFAFLANSILIPRFVFGNREPWKKQAIIYALTSAFFRIAEFLLFAIIFNIIKIDYRASLIMVLVASSTAKFFIYRVFYTARSGAS